MSCASDTSLHKGCKAECISERLLRKGFVTKCQLSELLDALPSDKKFASNRGQCIETTKTWTTVTKCQLSELLDALPSDKKFASNRGQCIETTKTWTTGVYRFSAR